MRNKELVYFEPVYGRIETWERADGPRIGGWKRRYFSINFELFDAIGRPIDFGEWIRIDWLASGPEKNGRVFLGEL